MELVWSRGEDVSVAEVHRALERSREIAYTTVMTTMARLHAKGLLERRRDGRRYVYRARLGRKEFLEETAREVLDSLAGDDLATAEALLVERLAEADLEELERLEAMIRARRRELEK